MQQTHPATYKNARPAHGLTSIWTVRRGSKLRHGYVPCNHPRDDNSTGLEKKHSSYISL